VRGLVAIPAGGAHGVQGSGERQRKLVKMVLEFTIAPEPEAAHDAHNRGGIRGQALGDGPHAEEHVFARVLERRTNDFLALYAQLLDALREARTL